MSIAASPEFSRLVPEHKSKPYEGVSGCRRGRDEADPSSDSEVETPHSPLRVILSVVAPQLALPSCRHRSAPPFIVSRLLSFHDLPSVSYTHLTLPTMLMV